MEGVHVYDMIPLAKILKGLVDELSPIVGGDGLGAPEVVNYILLNELDELSSLYLRRELQTWPIWYSNLWLPRRIFVGLRWGLGAL